MAPPGPGRHDALPALRPDLRRVSCRRCGGVRVEKVPWAAAGSWFTFAFEDQVGYLTQQNDQTTVCELMRIAWQTVGDIARRVVDRYGPRDRLDGLVHIGVYELSVRRRAYGSTAPARSSRSFTPAAQASSSTRPHLPPSSSSAATPPCARAMTDTRSVSAATVELDDRQGCAATTALARRARPFPSLVSPLPRSLQPPQHLCIRDRGRSTTHSTSRSAGIVAMERSML